MGTIGDRFADLAALLGAEGEAASERAADDAGALSADTESSVGGKGDLPSTSPAPLGDTNEADAAVGVPVGTIGAVSVSGLNSDSGSDPSSDAGSDPSSDSDSDPSSDSDSESGGEPTLQSALSATIAELNRVDVAELDLDQDFTALDLSGLPLWALVAEVERFLGRKFTDDEVGTWDTPRDIMRAAEKGDT